MVTNNAINIATGASGTILQGAGVGTAPTFSTATYPSTAGASGNVLTSDGTNWNSSAPSGGGGSNTGFYGSGVDGAVTFDGSTTVLGLAPSSNIYTLTRDILLASSTINSGVYIKTNGFRIFCSGTLTNNGTIYWNGSDASTYNAGAGPSNANSTFNVNTAAATAPGTTGGSGGGNSAGLPGVGATNHTYGGQGGTGGTGAAGAGGSGGALVGLSANYTPIYSLPYAVFLRDVKYDLTSTAIQGGTGGGSGKSDGLSNNSAGGGGGGAGIVFVSAYKFAGTGTIQAKGGNGANSTSFSGATGGGGGGGGGLLVVISSSVSGGAISGQTLDVSGGNGGSGISGGTAGTSGNSGNTILLNG